MAETLLEKAVAAQERLLKGEGTDEDYATVAEVSAAAITMQKSAKSDDADEDDAPAAADDDEDAGDDEDEDDVEKSLRIEDDEDDEDPGDMFKSMVAAAELAGADDPEEFIKADEILKGIGTGLDTIVSMLKGLDKRLTRIETFQKSLSTPPAAPAASAAPAKAEDPEVEAIRKSQAATAANLERMMAEVEGLKDYLGNRPASPHPTALGKSNGTSNGAVRAGVDALPEEVCLDILGKAADAKTITTDEAARCCDLIGRNRHLPAAEVIRKAAPGAMPMLKSLVEAQQ